MTEFDFHDLPPVFGLLFDIFTPSPQRARAIVRILFRFRYAVLLKYTEPG